MEHYHVSGIIDIVARYYYNKEGCITWNDILAAVDLECKRRVAKR